MSHADHGHAIRVTDKAANADALNPQRVEQAPPAIGEGQALVRVKSAGINPSDVKAALGLMPQAARWRHSWLKAAALKSALHAYQLSRKRSCLTS